MRVTARPRAVPRSVPGPPFAGAAGPRRLDRRCRGSRAAARTLVAPPHTPPSVSRSSISSEGSHRLRGEFAEAERGLPGGASRPRPRAPAPGLALLRLAGGHLDAAVAAIRRMTDESHGLPGHTTMGCRAAVDILLVAGDPPRRPSRGRRAGCDRRGMRRVPVCLRAGGSAGHAAGCVLLAGKQFALRSPPCGEASAGWRELGLPYDEARTRVQIAVACRALGDHDAAELELDEFLHVRSSNSSAPGPTGGWRTPWPPPRSRVCSPRGSTRCSARRNGQDEP